MAPTAPDKTHRLQSNKGSCRGSWRALHHFLSFFEEHFSQEGPFLGFFKSKAVPATTLTPCQRDWVSLCRDSSLNVALWRPPHCWVIHFRELICSHSFSRGFSSTWPSAPERMPGLSTVTNIFNTELCPIVLRLQHLQTGKSIWVPVCSGSAVWTPTYFLV